MRMTFVRLLAVLALASAPLIGGTIGAAADSSSAPTVAISEQAQFIGFSCSFFFGCGTTIVAQVSVSCSGGGSAGISVRVNQAQTATQGSGNASVLCDGSKHLVAVSVRSFSFFGGGGYQLGDAFAFAQACQFFPTFQCGADSKNIKIVL
jgi:hypothetical protein